MANELIVFVTVPNATEASKIAESLVSERLAACVNIVRGIESVYRWEGKVTRDDEFLLIIKTTDVRYGSLERRVKEMHSYTTPEVVAMPIQHGLPEYLRWLRDSTDSDQGPE